MSSVTFHMGRNHTLSPWWKYLQQNHNIWPLTLHATYQGLHIKYTQKPPLAVRLMHVHQLQTRTVCSKLSLFLI